MHADTVGIFLQGAEVVAAALAASAVAEAWDRPSVLEDQRVSGLAGHLARGGVWVVADYLDATPVNGPVDFTSAGDYFANLLRDLSPADHEAIRQRGADVAAVGQDDLVRTLGLRLAALGPRLRSLEPDHLLAVTGGKVMAVDDYLATRIVEQVVHLDDLARSIDQDPWTLPPGASELAIAVGTEIARRQAGSLAVVRALYRRGFAQQLLPVLSRG
jgi:hypothetical protein